ncbi:MAG: hypothetical protein Q4F65_12075 [Propionibacteriaceae bacterium]|nr:hypothetical protein [Propionibacteriaceae bacterium]
MQMTSPYGETLDVPSEGILALTALGWVADEQDKTPAKPTRRRTKASTPKEE